MMRRVVTGIMRRSLRQAFRRVVIVGEPVATDPGRPAVLYANHHYHHDAFLLWLAARSMNRVAITWMQEWDRFPLFAAVGAYPFPADDARRRARTVRSTARRMSAEPASALLYFPEAELHPEHEGVRPFGIQARLDSLLGHPQWIPSAVAVRWTSDSRPTAMVAFGTPHDGLSGHEFDLLSRLHAETRTADPGTGHVLLEGVQGVEEWLPFDRTRRFFGRYL